MDDVKFMRAALREARRGAGRTSPNPAVGAVILRGGRIVARGFHRCAGRPHAEIEALAALKNLTVVKLDYTAVDDKAMEALKTLPKLRELSLDSTNVTDTGAAALKSQIGRASCRERVCLAV